MGDSRRKSGRFINKKTRNLLRDWWKKTERLLVKKIFSGQFQEESWKGRWKSRFYKRILNCQKKIKQIQENHVIVAKLFAYYQNKAKNKIITENSVFFNIFASVISFNSTISFDRSVSLLFGWSIFFRLDFRLDYRSCYWQS